MLLFHSEHCNHCKMLLRSIQGSGKTSEIKQVSIEQIRASGRKLPPQIHSVPALMFSEQKNIIYGKQVFDFLFLPGRGFLTTGASASTSTPAPSAPADHEPAAFSLNGVNSISENYTLISESEHTAHAADNQISLDNRGSAWVSINDPVTLGSTEQSFQEETRQKKELPDLDAYRAERAKDLHFPDIKKMNVAPPIHTR